MEVTFGLGLERWIGVCCTQGGRGHQEAEECLNKVLKWVSDIFGSLILMFADSFITKPFLSIIFQHAQTTPGPPSQVPFPKENRGQRRGKWVGKPVRALKPEALG